VIDGSIQDSSIFRQFPRFPRDDEVIRGKGRFLCTSGDTIGRHVKLFEQKKETFGDKVGTFFQRSSRNDRDMKFRYVTLAN